ncbi:hypothetical protein BLNAU_15787 [Blattamonas nauphoetae]|uniref:Uncharacterized protein n=1 Tax=Blattamonas nauphoetae TaxID=2049346 RepID=A0ABQ9XBL5_9EUKA|nr:hypothetical protein BLNAU_15787 [Blattamonas nauphoetae]
MKKGVNTPQPSSSSASPDQSQTQLKEFLHMILKSDEKSGLITSVKDYTPETLRQLFIQHFGMDPLSLNFDGSVVSSTTAPAPAKGPDTGMVVSTTDPEFKKNSHGIDAISLFTPQHLRKSDNWRNDVQKEVHTDTESFINKNPDRLRFLLHMDHIAGESLTTTMFKLAKEFFRRFPMFSSIIIANVETTSYSFLNAIGGGEKALINEIISSKKDPSSSPGQVVPHIFLEAFEKAACVPTVCPPVLFGEKRELMDFVVCGRTGLIRHRTGIDWCTKEIVCENKAKVFQNELRIARFLAKELEKDENKQFAPFFPRYMDADEEHCIFKIFPYVEKASTDIRLSPTTIPQLIRSWSFLNQHLLHCNMTPDHIRIICDNLEMKTPRHFLDSSTPVIIDFSYSRLHSYSGMKSPSSWSVPYLSLRFLHAMRSHVANKQVVSVAEYTSQDELIALLHTIYLIHIPTEYAALLRLKSEEGVKYFDSLIDFWTCIPDSWASVFTMAELFPVCEGTCEAIIKVIIHNYPKLVNDLVEFQQSGGYKTSIQKKKKI